MRKGLGDRSPGFFRVLLGVDIWEDKEVKEWQEQ